MAKPCFVLHRTGEPWVGDWIDANDRDVTQKTYPDTTAALQSPMGQRWTLYEVVPEPQGDVPGWRITDRPF